MKYKVGYITAWRKSFFGTIILFLMVFGIIATVAPAIISIAIASNMLCAVTFIGGIILCLLVYADRGDRFTGFGVADFSEEELSYSDKKRHFSIKYSDIKKLDIEEILLIQNAGPFAFRIMIKTDRKTFYIESDRACGRAYNDTDIYNLYLELQRRIR